MLALALALPVATALPIAPEPHDADAAPSPWGPVLTRFDEEALEACLDTRSDTAAPTWGGRCRLATGSLDRLVDQEELPSGFGVPVAALLHANDLLMLRAVERLEDGDVHGAASDLAAPLRWSADLGHARTSWLGLMLRAEMGREAAAVVAQHPDPRLVEALEPWLAAEPASAEERAWTLVQACEQDRRQTVALLSALPGVEGLSRDMAWDCAQRRADLLGEPIPAAPTPTWAERANPYRSTLQRWRTDDTPWANEADPMLATLDDTRAAAWQALLDAEEAAAQRIQESSAKPRP